MSDKKRKKSFQVEQKRQAAKNEQEAKARKKKEIILMCVIGVLIFAIVFGLVFGIRALIKNSPDDDRSELCDTRGIPTGKDAYNITMKIKGYDGEIKIVLDKKAAPETVNHFVTLVRDKFYDGKTFDSVINGELLGGGKAAEGEEKADTVKGELSTGIPHVRGVISMARDDDADSATSEFFILLDDASRFDGNRASFGYVTSGLKILDEIADDASDYAKDGAISDASKRPVIEYMKVDEFEHDSENETEPDIFAFDAAKRWFFDITC